MARSVRVTTEEGVLVETETSRRTSVPYFALGGIVVGAVLLRIGLAFALPRVVKWDETTYLEIGRNLVTGQGFVRGLFPVPGQVELKHPPLQPIVLGISYWVSGDLEWASNLAHALFGAILLLPVFAVTRRIYGSQTAWLTVILLAIFPALTVSVLYWGAMIEPLYLFLLFGGLAALLAGIEDDKLGMFAAAGAFFGLAYLARPEGFFYFAAFLILAMLCLVERRGLRLRRTWGALVLYVLFFATFAVPYMGYLHAHTGIWTLSGKLDVAWDASTPMITGDWAAWDRMASDQWFNKSEASDKALVQQPKPTQRNVLAEILVDPTRLIRQTYANIPRLANTIFAKHIFWYLFTPLVVLALFKRPWDRRRLQHETFLAATIAVLLVVFLPMGVLIRYFAPAFPVLLMWLAQGSLDFGVWLRESLELVLGRPLLAERSNLIFNWLPAGVLVLFLLLMIPVAARTELGNESFGHKQAGLWLRTHTPADAKVVTRSGIVSFYANRREIGSPNTDWTRFLKYARAEGANYVVMDSFELTKLRPQFHFILDRGAPELELVYKFKERNFETFVYRLIPSRT